MGLLDEIDEEFTAEETNETETEEGKNNTSEGEEVEGSESEEGDGEEGEEKPEGEETEEKKEPEEGDKKPKNGVQKRIDQYHKRLKDAERENYNLRQKLEDVTRQEQPARKAPEPPNPENYKTLTEFNIAKAKYETAVDYHKQAIAEDAQRAHDDVQRSVADKIRAEKDKYEDFAEVMDNISDLPIHDDVLSGLVIKDPNGVDTLYWLGNHRERAEAISRLKPAEQALALGRISANIKAQRTGKQVSGAPKPPAKVGGNSGAAQPKISNLSGDAYAAWKNKQKAKSSKG